MLELHHLNASRSTRILWTMEELGVPYTIVRYQRNPKTMLAPPELKKIHPLGKSPVVKDGDRVLAESAAIIEYLVERYGGGRLIPAAGSEARLRYGYFMHYAEGSLMPFLFLKLVLTKMGPLGWPAQSYVNGQLATHLGFLEGELASRPHFAGDEFTAADIQMSFPVEAARGRAGLDGRYPRLLGWIERIQARPAYKKAAEVA